MIHCYSSPNPLRQKVSVKGSPRSEFKAVSLKMPGVGGASHVTSRGEKHYRQQVPRPCDRKGLSVFKKPEHSQQGWSAGNEERRAGKWPWQDLWAVTDTEAMCPRKLLKNV